MWPALDDVTRITYEVIDFVIGIPHDGSGKETLQMTSYAELIDRYFAAWNETDPDRRKELVTRTWTEDSTYLDPLVTGEGRSGIDAMIEGVQKQFPSLQFRRSTDVDVHNERVRFAWELGPEDGQAVAGGVDFGVTRDGLLHSVIGFIDFAPVLKM
jgi:hypothetical protein